MMPQLDDYSRLVYLAGSIYSRVAELHQLLQQFASEGKYQGELHLTHQLATGETTKLAIHIDGTDFSIMPADSDEGLRFDVSGLSATLD